MRPIEVLLDVDPAAGTITVDPLHGTGGVELPLTHLALRFFGEIVVWIEVVGPNVFVGWEPDEDGNEPELVPIQSVGERRWMLGFRTARP
jgi:hypothetical protein